MQAIRHSHRDHKAAPTPADDVIPVTPEDLNHYTNPTTRITDAWTYRASSIATRMSMNTDSARTRHICASRLYQSGMSLFAIQELLGHAWTGTTARYIHVHGTHVEDAWVAGQQRAADRWKGLAR
jgi:site-specific recombinase XerD